MALYNWSQTSANNATADTSINWQEGQAPSSINDSARAMMAATAKYRDDTSGSITAGGTGGVSGTASAYNVTSNQNFISYAALALNEISFVCPATNAVGVTLNVDGTGAQPINGTNGVPIPAGTMIVGGIYTLTAYTNGQFILHSFTGNPFNIPLGGGMDYWLPTLPNSNFAFPVGQAISRTTYSTLYALMGNTYGAGDGSTTFNLPNKGGRVSAAADLTGNVLNGSTMSPNGAVLGAIGGGQTSAIGQTNLPNVNFPVSGSASVASTIGNVLFGGITTFSNGTGTSQRGIDFSTGATQISSTGSISGSAASGGSGTPMVNIQPTIICNYIMRII